MNPYRCTTCGSAGNGTCLDTCPGCGNRYCTFPGIQAMSCMRKHLGSADSCPTPAATDRWSTRSNGLRSMAVESLNILHENKAVRSGLTTLRTILLRVDDRLLSSNVVRGIVDAAQELTQDEQAAWQKYMKRVQDLLTEKTGEG